MLKLVCWFALIALAWRVEAQAPPIITGFSPDTGWPGLEISIIGEHLTDLTEVTFNGVPARIGGWMNFFAVVVVPTNATTGPVTVATRYGSCTSATPFVITEPHWDLPRDPIFSPAQGLPGTKVQIQARGPTGDAGGNNLDRVTRVLFNGVEAIFTFEGILGSIVATVPLTATTGPITIVTPEGSVTSASSFSVLPAAQLTGFVPDHGVPGTMVQLVGDHLDQVTAAWFGGTWVAIIRNNGFFIQVPPTASTGPIRVDTPYSHQTSTDVFRVERSFDLQVFGTIGTTSETHISLPAVVALHIQLLNNGPELVKEVVFVDTFLQVNASLADPWKARGSAPSDSSLTVISAVASQGVLRTNAGAIQVDIGDLPGGAIVDVDIALQANRSGVLYHLTQATTSSPDPDLSNNHWVNTALVGDAFAVAIRFLGNRTAELSWPTLAAGWVLQSRDQLSGASWQDWGGSMVEQNGTIKTLDTLAAQSRYYRLVRH